MRHWLLARWRRCARQVPPSPSGQQGHCTHHHQRERGGFGEGLDARAGSLAMGKYHSTRVGHSATATQLGVFSMHAVQRSCRWSSFVGILAIAVGGCSRAPTQSQSAVLPQAVAATPGTSRSASKPEAEQSRDKRRVPTGPVKIVNRKTGLALHGGGVKRIEPAGADWKIRLGESDKFWCLRVGRRKRNMRPGRPKAAIRPSCMGLGIPKTP